MYIYIYTYIYILYKYITYLALKTMIVQNNIKHINTIGLAAAAKAAAAIPIVCRGLILFCTHCFLGLAMLYIYIIDTYMYICIYIYMYTYVYNIPIV